MCMILVSSLYGPHASSLRPERAPSPGAARPGPPLPSPRTQRPLVGRRAGRHRARVAGPLWHLAPPLSPRLPRGSQPGGLARVCAICTGNRAGASRWRPDRSPPRPGPSRRHGSAKTTGPQSLGRSRGGWTPTLPRGAADDRPALACALSPGPAPRSSRGAEGPGVRGRPAAALGRGTGVGARGAAATEPGEPLGVCPGAVHAAQCNRAGVSSIAGVPPPLHAMRATRHALPRMQRLRPHH